MHGTRSAFIALAGVLVGLVAPLAAQNPQLVAPTDPLSPQEQLTKFHLPPGFQIELIASEPQTPKPINMSFDAAGRLYVTCSLEYPFPAPDDRPHRDTIQRILDTDGDGVPDRVTTFAEGLNIPIGVTPLADGVLGYSIPNIDRFTDADGDGRADGRELAYGSLQFIDTHGMASSFTWWIDGWVYACHGFRNTSTLKGADGQAVTMNSGNTYRLRPDGSHIEQWTWGQVNPFGMAFDPLGNQYTSDCHTKPVYMLLRGAYYPSFGKPHDGLGYGPEMMSHSHNSTGIAGVVYYAAEQFPEAYRGTLLVGNPVTGTINHDRLEWHGSSPRAVELPDFLTCDDPWFRPVHIQLAPDGSLYVADFYNCIIGHYEVPLTHPRRDRERGRIWRISYVGTDDEPATATQTPDLETATADELIASLGSPNLAVRVQATHQLVHRIGAAAVGPVKQLLHSETSSPEQRTHGLWVLARLEALDEELVARLAADSERLVRVHLVKSLAERPEWSESERTLVLARLQDDDAFVRRAAVDALGRHPHPDHVAPLLELWRTTPGEDVQLIHTLRIALRDTIAQLHNLMELAHDPQTSPERLERLADISLGLATPQSAEFLLARGEADTLPAGRVPEALRHIGRHLDEPSLPRLFALALRFRDRDRELQRQCLRLLNQAVQARRKPLPDDLRQWATQLANRLLRTDGEGPPRRGIELARELRLRETADGLVRLAVAESRSQPLRADALNTLIGIDRKLALTALAGVLAALDEPLALRQSAADSLGSLNTTASRDVLLAQLKVAPQALSVSIARALAGSRDGAEALLTAVQKGTAAPRLLQDTVTKERLAASGLKGVGDRLETLLRGLPPVDERTRELIAARRKGYRTAEPDLTIGAAAYKKHCAACHRLSNEGTKIGPELDGIGVRGVDRLLEDVLDPNRNVDGAFRASLLVLNDGRVLTGLVLREEGDVLVLVDERGKEHRIPRGEIDERRNSKLSPMPANVSDLLSEAEFYNLLGYLLDQRQE